MKPEELIEELATKLESKNVVLEAYPGWGKTRLATILAERSDSVVIVTRTHEEMYEILKFSDGRLIPLYGKEKLCPMWNRKGEDMSVYRYCRAARITGLCKYKYAASHDMIRWFAGRKPRPEEVVEMAKKLGVCPYPSILALAKSKRIVTTYGFAFTFKEVLEDKALVVFDESHEILNVVLGLVEKIDDAYVETLFKALKKDVETRQLAYFIRACWRKAKNFKEFVEMLERAPSSHELIDSIINSVYSKKAYWSGKEGYVLLYKPNDFRKAGSLFLTAYLPPFFLNLIPNLEIVKVPGEVAVNVIIDADATSRYEERSEETYRVYAEKIEDYYVANAANLVVFPSYEFMENVKRYLPSYILEKAKPPDAIRELKDGDIVFDVAGGRSTEGVNPSPLLKRVIVAGLPYPPPTPELNLMSKIYGFDAVYTYLGLLKVVQAVGRLRFRENADAVLIDRRYANVKQFFPSYFATT